MERRNYDVTADLPSFDSFVAAARDKIRVPISMQPLVGNRQSDNLTGRANPTDDCPPGLAYLKTVDQLLIRQKLDSGNNRYVIKNALGQNVYYAIENTDLCERCCYGKFREFNITLYDNFDNEVINLQRHNGSCDCTEAGRRQYMQVSAPPGNNIGTVERERTWCFGNPIFHVKNQYDQLVMYIEGDSWYTTPTKFNVSNLNKQQIGVISKQWAGLLRELFTDADFFGINFPLDLDPQTKALLLSATFLFDMEYFED